MGKWFLIPGRNASKKEEMMVGKKKGKKIAMDKSVQQSAVATELPSVEELLAALEEELEKPLPPSLLLDSLDSNGETLEPPLVKSLPRHIAEPRRDEGLGIAEKRMIGRMWHQLADKFADEEEK